MNKKLTASIIIGTFIIWIAFDVWLAKNGGPTESQMIRDWAKECVFWPHLLGFLCSHWFIPRKRVTNSGWMYGLVIWVVLIAWDVWWHYTTRTVQYPWYRYSGIWFLTGLPAGFLCWPQPLESSPVE